MPLYVLQWTIENQQHSSVIKSVFDRLQEMKFIIASPHVIQVGMTQNHGRKEETMR